MAPVSVDYSENYVFSAGANKEEMRVFSDYFGSDSSLFLIILSMK
jgi:hypothetical protein